MEIYSSYALGGAFDEITLVLFTTLAPAGALAYVIMALPLMIKGDALSNDMRKGLLKYLCIPILVSMLGLIASTTHLGNLANALYVLSGFGRSPLSNEVVCGVVFLGAAGVFWLSSFSDEVRMNPARRIALLLISILGFVFIGSISLAYDAETIITWADPLAVASLWLNAFIGGPLLALFGFRMARFYTPAHRLGHALVGVSAFAFIADLVLYNRWEALLSSSSNSLTSADQLAPFFGIMIICFALLCAVGIFFAVRSVRYKGEAPLWLPLCSVFFVLCGTFVMRFSFYMIHMTVGVGI